MLDETQKVISVKVETVVRVLNRLVGTAEADEVGGDDPTAARQDHRDHLAVDVAPRRLTVQTQERLFGVPGA